MEEKCYHRDPFGAFTEENCPCPCSFCAEKNHGSNMTEPNMEWEEQLRKRFNIGYSEYGLVIEYLREVIEEAETRAYEKGKAEERERIDYGISDLSYSINNEAVEEIQNGVYYISVSDVISLIHDNK